MSDTNTAPTAPAKAEPTTTQGNPEPATEKDWQAKFEAQQKVNRNLETKFNELRDSQAKQTQALAQALGIDPKQGPAPDISVLAGTVQTLQEQWTQAQLDNRALSIAAEHGITNQSDIDTLRAIKDEATMRSVAARFAASSAAQSGLPKPDLTQGAQGTPAGGTPEQDFANFLGGALNR